MPVLKEAVPSRVGDYIRELREQQGVGIRELCRAIDLKIRTTGKSVSPAYLSQVEIGRAAPESISMDFLWAVGVALGVNPLKLFVLARTKIDQRYVDPIERRRLFSVD